jgi:hypothetical protein
MAGEEFLHPAAEARPRGKKSPRWRGNQVPLATCELIFQREIPGRRMLSQVGNTMVVENGENSEPIGEKTGNTAGHARTLCRVSLVR